MGCPSETRDSLEDNHLSSNLIEFIKYLILTLSSDCSDVGALQVAYPLTIKKSELCISCFSAKRVSVTLQTYDFALPKSQDQHDSATAVDQLS